MLYMYIIGYPLSLLMNKLFGIEIPYKNITIILLIFLYIALNIKSIVCLKFNKLQGLIFICLVIIISELIFNHFYGEDCFFILGNNFVTLREYSLIFIISNFSLFILMCVLGMNLEKLVIFSKKKIIRIVTLIFYFILCILICIIKFKFYNKDGIALLYETWGHILISETFIILTYFILLIEKKSFHKYIRIISIIILYIIGSRSTFYFFVAVSVMNMVKNSDFKNKLSIAGKCFVVCIFCLSIILGINYNSKLINFDENSRMLAIFNINEDISYKERNFQQIIGKEIINKKYFSGDLFYEIKYKGTTGAYIHNILSYWAEFGIVVFLILILIITNISINILWRKNRYYNNYDLFIEIFIFSIMNLITVKSYTYTLIWMSISIFSKLERKSNKGSFSINT